MKNEPGLLGPYIKKAVNKLLSYPVILIVCYAVVSYRFIVDMLYPDTDNYSTTVIAVSDIILSLQGFFTAVVFWVSNPSIGTI
jgi:hypothetical protein